VSCSEEATEAARADCIENKCAGFDRELFAFEKNVDKKSN
jgi:hypothetical protein